MILNEMDKYCESSEPRYESLPHVSSNDPGYETVIGTTRKPNSDYDPNYEVLRPTEQNSNNTITGINNYPNNANNSNINLIQNIETNTDRSYNHVYASIAEENKRNFLNNNDVSASTKNDNKSTNLSFNDGAEINSVQHHNYSTISEAQSELLSLISSTSQDVVTKTRNSSEHSNLSELKTTPSASDSNSSDLQIGYNSIRTTNNDDSRLTSSNYESLTGSESDPNYESVRYVDEKENPYERLHNNDEMLQSPTNVLEISVTTITATMLTENKIDKPAITTTTTMTNSDSLEVSDYFQV